MRGIEIDDTAERGVALARIVGLEGCGFRREPGDETVGDLAVDDDALGRHADLPLVHESAESRSGDGLLDIGVVEYQQWRLAAQFEQRRLEIAPREFGDHPAHTRRTGEVDAAHRRMGDERRHELGRVLGRIGHDVEHPLGQACFLQRLGDEAVGPRAELARLEDDGVAAGEGRRQRAHPEDHRGVPRRDREHHARRLADTHRKAARPVGRDHLAGDLRGQRSRLAQHVGGEADVEAGPARGRADLGRHGVDEVGGLGLEPVRRLQQDRAALAWR